jgi:hypothetical protein
VGFRRDPSYISRDDSIDITYALFIFPRDALETTNVDHVDFSTCDDIAMTMPCYECF